MGSQCWGRLMKKNGITLLSLLGFVLLLWSPSYGRPQSEIKTKKIAKAEKKFNLLTDFYMGAFGFQEGQDDSQLIYLSARPYGSYFLTESFGVQGDIQLNLTTGRSQTRFQNPNFNSVNIRELVAHFKPGSYLGVKGGAINQNFLGNPMLIADRGFPGVYVQSGYQSEVFSVLPKVQYSIPTSTSYESQRTEAEALPALKTFGLALEVKPLEWLQLSSDIHHFEYNQLPAVVAAQSNRFGNSVVGVDSESSFRYQFEGLSQFYTLKTQYTSFLSQSFQVGMVDNFEAPQDRRRSQWVGTGFNWTTADFNISPSFASFFAESDSVPAIYSEFELGRNNRQGQMVRLAVEIKKWNLIIRSRYVESQLIEQRPLQADMKIFDLGLEFTNVFL